MIKVSLILSLTMFALCVLDRKRKIKVCWSYKFENDGYSVCVSVNISI